MMQKERFLSRSAAQIYLMREHEGKTQILFGMRSGDIIDLANGSWDVAGGHLEEGESFIKAANRLTKKEYNITFDEEDIKFTTIIHVGKHNIVGMQYINAHFFIDKWTGTPSIGEPDKMNKLEWIDIDNLPTNLNFDRNEAINNYLKQKTYSEIGFDKEI